MVLSPKKLHKINDDGVLHVRQYAGPRSLEMLQSEIDNPNRVQWRDVHDEYVNNRGLTIIQNHLAFAAAIGRGDQSLFGETIPNIYQASMQMTKLIRDMRSDFPVLRDWFPNELSLHKYDNAETGLSFHKDNARFIGAIAILSIAGECQFSVKNERAEEIVDYPCQTGDLAVLRAPGLFDTEEDIRPEHAVLNPSDDRVSLTIRMNCKPYEKFEGYEYVNWS